MASLYVIRGRDSGQHFPIRGELATVGRDASNQIRLQDTEVSRTHAWIVRKHETEHEIQDRGSSNGTYVNSRRIDRQILQSGDRVQVGRTLMIYTGGPEPHSTRSHGQVEIVEKYQSDELSNIRASIESRRLVLPPDGPLAFGENQASEARAAQSTGAQAAEAAEKIDSPMTQRGDDASLDSQSRSSGGHAPQLSSADWEIIFHVGQAISRTGDLQDLLAQVLDLIFQWIDCDRGCIMMLDDVTGLLVPTTSRDAASHGPNPKKHARPRKISISRTILDHVVETKEGVLTSNAQDDSRWGSVESIADLGVHEAICVPMLGRYGLVGAIYVDTQISPGALAERHGTSCFDQDHLKLMLAIAGQAALAIEDTQFYHAMLQSERLAAMGQTIANLSHHVKNILQGVRGGSYLVEDGIKKSDLDVVRKGWSIVERNQERISNLVMDMLSFSKDREPELKRLNLCQVIDDVVELMRVRATDHAVELIWQTPAEPIEADFDDEAMHRAVLNVVTNAIDAASQFERVDESAAGRVLITAELQQAKGIVRIDVEDNGSGIADQELTKIFSPFESNKGARGTGLGLPVSQKILREHGGDITVRSRLGDGTTFTLQWPAYRSQMPGEQVPGDAAPPQTGAVNEGPQDDWDNRATL